MVSGPLTDTGLSVRGFLEVDGVAVEAVPEPSTVVGGLLGAVIFGLGCWRSRWGGSGELSSPGFPPNADG